MWNYLFSRKHSAFDVSFFFCLGVALTHNDWWLLSLIPWAFISSFGEGKVDDQ
jgi:hypothetical protein